MAIYRTRTHFDIDTSKYEHEYIINNYSKVFRYLHIETYVDILLKKPKHEKYFFSLDLIMKFGMKHVNTISLLNQLVDIFSSMLS